MRLTHVRLSGWHHRYCVAPFTLPGTASSSHWTLSPDLRISWSLEFVEVQPCTGSFPTLCVTLGILASRPNVVWRGELGIFGLLRLEVSALRRTRADREKKFQFSFFCHDLFTRRGIIFKAFNLYISVNLNRRPV
jgi:hypothetical protein